MKKSQLTNALKAVKAKSNASVDNVQADDIQAVGGIQSLKLGLDHLSAGAPQLVNPDDIRDSIIKDRFDVTSDLQDLTESIKKSGQQLPVLLRRLANGSQRYEVVYGRRRIAACKILGIDVKAHITNMNERDALLSQGLENSARLQRSFIEQAVYASTLLTLEDLEISRDDVIEILATDSSTVSRMLSVVNDVPMPVISKIGPAHDAGRRPWMQLRKIFTEQKLSEAEALEEIDINLTSKERLFDLLKKLSNHSAGTKQKNQEHLIVLEDGKVTAKISQKRLLVTEAEAATGFSRYLSERLEELYSDFVKTRS